MILKIWHYEKHDDATVSELSLRGQSIGEWIKERYSLGGFWKDRDTFIPWHRINQIELESMK